MDPRVQCLTTVKECDQFVRNVQARLPELAREARVRRVELQAAEHAAMSDAGQEAWVAIYAYEEVRSQPGGRRFRASRTRQMIDKYGIIGAVEKTVSRKDDPAGFMALEKMGMLDKAFEAVVDRHPDEFTAEAVAQSRPRLAKWRSGE